MSNIGHRPIFVLIMTRKIILEGYNSSPLAQGQALKGQEIEDNKKVSNLGFAVRHCNRPDKHSTGRAQVRDILDRRWNGS